MNCRSCPNAQLCRRARWRRLAFILSRIPRRSSRAIPQQSRCALATTRLAIPWLTSRWYRRCRPEIFLSFRRAARVPRFCRRSPVDVNPPFLFHRLSAVGLRFAVRKQVGRPQITAQVLLHGGGGRDVHLHHLMQDELAPPIAHHRLMATGQPCLRAGGKWELKAIHGQRAVALVLMLVHGDRPASPKRGLVLSALFVTICVGDLPDDDYGRRRGQLKPLPHLPIGAALEG